MKLIRHGAPGRERPGLVDADGIARDLSAVIDDLHWQSMDPAALARLDRLKPSQLPRVPAGRRLGVPFAGISKFIESEAAA